MEFLESLFSGLNIYWTTFLFCFAGGLVPILNTEIYLMSIFFLAVPASIWPLVLIATSGQLISKTLVFLAGRGVIRFPLKRYEKKMETVKEKFDRWKSGPYLFIFISAFAGIPPFYAVTFFAGLIRLDLTKFLIVGFLGRFLRFALAVLLPQLFLKTFIS
jgi:membrane protein YqaA with SNARE-associated domain